MMLILGNFPLIQKTYYYQRAFEGILMPITAAAERICQEPYLLIDFELSSSSIYKN